MPSNHFIPCCPSFTWVFPEISVTELPSSLGKSSFPSIIFSKTQEAWHLSTIHLQYHVVNNMLSLFQSESLLLPLGSMFSTHSLNVQNEVKKGLKLLRMFSLTFFTALNWLLPFPQSIPGVTLIQCGLINRLQNDSFVSSHFFRVFSKQRWIWENYCLWARVKGNTGKRQAALCLCLLQ